MSSGWKSYNVRNAASYGFEYKVDKYCGNVQVRDSKNRQRIFNFSSHPTPQMFFMMTHYPTLVGVDDSRLCELVLSKLETDEAAQSLIGKVEKLQKALTKNTELRLAQEEQHGQELRQNTALTEAIRREKEEVEKARNREKKKYVTKIKAMKEEQKAQTQKLKAMKQAIEALQKTSNFYKKKYGESNEILNLTSASLSILKDLPQQILSLQKQININLDNENYKFDNMARLLQQNQFVEKNTIIADFSKDFLRMLGAMPYAFTSGDSGELKRNINSRPYGIGIGSLIKSVIPDGKYTFEDIADRLAPITIFDLAFCSIRVQTTTTTHRFNRDGKKLLSSFSLAEIITNLNNYGVNIDIDSVDMRDKDYYRYCLSVLLLKRKNAAMVERAFEVLTPITLKWEEGTDTGVVNYWVI